MTGARAIVELVERLGWFVVPEVDGAEPAEPAPSEPPEAERAEVGPVADPGLFSWDRS